MSNTLQPCGLQHIRLPHPSLSPSLLRFMSIESVMLSNHLIFCHPLLLPSIFPSIRVFPNELALHIRWQKYWSFSFSISPSNEYSVWISFRIYWFDLLAVQGLLRVFSSTTFGKHQFFGAQPSLWSIWRWLLEKSWLWLDGSLSAKWCFCFLICCLVCHSFSSKEKVSFDFMAAITICSDFGAQKNKVWHRFHCFPIYFP